MQIQEKKEGRLPFLTAVGAACLVFAVMQGIHDNYGILLQGIVEHSSISYAQVSLVIGIGQILYGATQPLFGMLALKRSHAFVMLCGLLLMAAGLIVTPFCRTLPALLLFSVFCFLQGQGRSASGLLWGRSHPSSERSGQLPFPVSFRQARG